MNKEKIIEILNEWNFWNKDIDSGILRNICLCKLLEFINTDKIISIVGVRRSGKSTLIKQMAKALIEKGTLKNDILIVNFEEPQLESADINLLINIYQAYNEIIKPQKKPYVFLDEIQNVKNWERFARSISEKKEANLIISDSSSRLLSEELATVLTGRQLYYEIFPLSFIELLSFKKLKIEKKEDVLLNASKIKIYVREYALYGGFPEVVLNDNEEFKRRVLLSYYEDIINRDIVQRFKIKKFAQLKALVNFYLTNISSSASFNSISRFIKLPVETVSRFSSYIDISDLIFFVKRFSFSVKEQENSPRKIYSIDTGMSNVAGFRFSQDWGKLAEAIVALKLKALKTISPLTEIYYWKDQYTDKEVDFVVKDGTDIKGLIQVCWDINTEKTKKREISSLLKAMDEFKFREGLVITEDYEDSKKIKDKIIIFKSLWKWLCE